MCTATERRESERRFMGRKGNQFLRKNPRQWKNFPIFLCFSSTSFVWLMLTKCWPYNDLFKPFIFFRRPISLCTSLWLRWKFFHFSLIHTRLASLFKEQSNDESQLLVIIMRVICLISNWMDGALMALGCQRHEIYWSTGRLRRDASFGLPSYLYEQLEISDCRHDIKGTFWRIFMILLIENVFIPGLCVAAEYSVIFLHSRSEHTSNGTIFTINHLRKRHDRPKLWTFTPFSKQVPPMWSSNCWTIF